MHKVQSAEDKKKATNILTAAFTGDTITEYILPSESGKKAFFNIITNFFTNHTYLYEDKAAAVWFKKGEANKSSIWQYFRSPISSLKMFYESGRKGKNFGEALDRVEQSQRRKLGISQYYYIYFLAVDPRFQGQSLGSRMLNEITSKADRENLPVLLEASNENSRKLYLRHGFEEFDRVYMPDDQNVKFMLMIRNPKTAQNK